MSSPERRITSPASTSSETLSDAIPRSRRTRVSAEHTLNRVRENQRRHRARQRNHISSLEQKLADAERLLAEARAEIAALKAEQAAATAICQLNQLQSHDSTTTAIRDQHVAPAIQEVSSSASTHQTLEATHVNYPDMDLYFLSASPSTNSTTLPPTSLPTTLFTNNTTSVAPSLCSSNPSSSSPLPLALLSTGPPPCCEEIPTPSSPTDPQCPTCKTRPPPSPTESTTLCAQAYIMISQQNFRNLDPGTIRMWLAQGLRRAQREGEGCRVENGALLRLLDYISGL